MTEPTGERFQTSAELGPAFGRVPIKTVLDSLTSPELRDDHEANEVAEVIEVIWRYFVEGGTSDVWRPYLHALKATRMASDNQSLPKQVYEKYQEISEIIYATHLQYVDEEVAAINNFLVHYPDVVVQDAGGDTKLVSVESINMDPAVLMGMPKQLPVQQFAWWSNETRVELTQPTPLFIDMAALPEGFSKRLNQYRALYEITIGD